MTRSKVSQTAAYFDSGRSIARASVYAPSSPRRAALVPPRFSGRQRGRVWRHVSGLVSSVPMARSVSPLARFGGERGNVAREICRNFVRGQFGTVQAVGASRAAGRCVGHVACGSASVESVQRGHRPCLRSRARQTAHRPEQGAQAVQARSRARGARACGRFAFTTCATRLGCAARRRVWQCGRSGVDGAQGLRHDADLGRLRAERGRSRLGGSCLREHQSGYRVERK